MYFVSNLVMYLLKYIMQSSAKLRKEVVFLILNTYQKNDGVYALVQFILVI